MFPDDGGNGGVEWMNISLIREEAEQPLSMDIERVGVSTIS